MARFSGWGIRVQVGRTYVGVTPWPFDWEWSRSLMLPQMYGLGVWITHDPHREA